MAKRRGDSGRKDAGWQAYFLKAWQDAKGLFDYRQADTTLAGALPGARFYGALAIIAAAGIIACAITMATNLEAAYLANFMIDTLREAGMGTVEHITAAGLAPMMAANFLLIVPFGIAYEIAVAAASFSILRLMGGKGTLAAHFQLYSLVFLAQSMVTVLALAIPLPCLNMLAMVAMVVITIYLCVYVRAKAYVAVHQVPFAYALALAGVLLIGNTVVITCVTNALAAFFGLPQIPINILGV